MQRKQGFTSRNSTKLCYTLQKFQGLKLRPLDIQKSTCYFFVHIFNLIFRAPLLLFVSGIVQYRCMRLPKTDDMIEHIKMIQIPYLDIWSILLSEQVPHRLIWIEAIQVTCSGISRSPCAKH